MRPLKKIIDLSAFQHNLRQLKTFHPNLIAVIKANAYGHEVSLLKDILAQECQQVAVASIDEALQLRKIGYQQEIILLEGIFSPDEISLAKRENFLIVAHSSWQVEVLTAAASAFWLKIDTGMHRLGFSPQEALPHLKNKFCQGYISHFACADDENSLALQKQLQVLEALPKVPRILANSPALLSLNLDAVAARAGLAMYGLSPFANKSASELNLRPVMTLQTEVIAVKSVQAGDAIGYGGHFIAPHDAQVAVIALGYGDGFNRSIENERVYLALNSKKYPLVGRVSMDMSTLWLGQDTANCGDKVIVFGMENPAEIVAQQAQTIPYTLTAMLTARVPYEIKQ